MRQTQHVAKTCSCYRGWGDALVCHKNIYFLRLILEAVLTKKDEAVAKGCVGHLYRIQGCQEDCWGPGQGFEVKLLHRCYFCELILYGFKRTALCL